jgi:hypothetical protein
VSKPPLPPNSSNAYLWWQAGAADEAAARDDGLAPQIKELRNYVESYARGRGLSTSVSPQDIVIHLARVFAPDVLKRKHRL